MKSKQEVLTILRNKILFLEMLPGSPVIDIQIAQELDVSRTPVREALLALQKERLIDIYPQRGTFVSLLDLKFLEEAAYVRHVVERDVLMGLAMRRMELGAEIERCLDLQELTAKSHDVKEYVLNDIAFHQALFKFAGHEQAWTIIESQFRHVIRFQMLYLSNSDSLFEKSLDEHRIILQCIANGDMDRLDAILRLHHDCVRQNKVMVSKTYSKYCVKGTGF